MMLDWIEHINEIFKLEDGLALEDQVKHLSLSLRAVLIGRYGYSTVVNHCRPYLKIHASLHGRSISYEFTRFCRGRIRE